MTPLVGPVSNARPNPWLSQVEELKAVIQEWAPDVARAAESAGLTWVGDGKALLGAAAENESAFGANASPRFEPSYYYGSPRYQKSPELRAAIARHGALAACSWGPWQIMAMNALRLGYSLDEPLHDLWYASTSAPLVVALAEEILTKQRPKTPEDFGDAWNSGRFGDAIPPPVAKYRADFARRFRDVVTRRGL